MKVGYYSPLPPARTGVADYAGALLGALRRQGAVEIGAAEADVFHYHLGNNQLHRDIYQRALQRPGVVVLHDALLQHFFLGSLTEEQYISEFTYNYGDWHRDTARELWRNRAASAMERRYFDYPMLRRIAEVSRAVVVHNPAAARMVKEHAPSARVVEIPHLFTEPALREGNEAAQLRVRWGVGPRTFLFGVFGYLRETKRLSAILRAFEKIRRACSDTALLIAGECVSTALERDLPQAGQGIVRLPYLEGDRFWRAAAAVDACINLRYPPAGETSGIATFMMGIGKPVLVTAGEETSRYPETACLRIEPGLEEQASLIEYGMLVRRFPIIGHEIGRRAADYIRREHAIERVAGEYWRVLCEAGS